MVSFSFCCLSTQCSSLSWIYCIWRKAFSLLFAEWISTRTVKCQIIYQTCHWETWYLSLHDSCWSAFYFLFSCCAYSTCTPPEVRWEYFAFRANTDAGQRELIWVTGMFVAPLFVFVPVSMLYSVRNKTYYYYYYLSARPARTRGLQQSRKPPTLPKSIQWQIIKCLSLSRLYEIIPSISNWYCR